MVLVRVDTGKDGYLRLKLVDPLSIIRLGEDVIYNLSLSSELEEVIETVEEESAETRTKVEDESEDVRDDIGVIDHHWHSRWRVYPQDVSVEGIQLTSAAVVNTFGAWVEIVPLNTIPFIFEVVGLVIEQVSVAETYHVQLGYNIINADPGENMEMGERRLRIATLPIARATELLDIRSQEMPANSRVMGRVKTASGNADWARISIVVVRHVDVSREVPLYPAFPW